MDSIGQDLIVALLVPGCAVYAFCKLAPAALRRSMAAEASRARWLPAAWRSRAARLASTPAGGCGCDGCDHRAAPNGTPAAPGAVPIERPIVLHLGRQARGAARARNL